MFKKLILLLIASVIFSNAFAVFHLDINQGLIAPQPIAVIPFAGENQLGANQQVSQIIRDDLQMSGNFNVFDAAKIRHFPSSAATLNFNTWQQRKMNDVVVGKITPIGADSYQVHFQLIDAFGNQAQANSAAPAWQSAILIDKVFIAKQQQLRHVAHQISNLIYQKLTGVPGIFTSKIAYVLVKRTPNQPSYYYLEVSDVDGYDAKPILTSMQPITEPTWSPDGKQIAYVSFEQGHSAVYIQNLATGQRHIVTKIKGKDQAYPGINGSPAFSPNGKELAMVLTINGYPKIYLVNLASGAITQLTTGWANDTDPSFAPDGQSIIFTSDREGSPQIYQMNLASKQIKRLTFVGGYNASASFTPDGQSIVMLHRVDGRYTIALQNLASGQIKVLTKTADDQSPSMAANGRMIVYATKIYTSSSREYGPRSILALVSVNGKVNWDLLRPQANTSGQIVLFDMSSPAWQPVEG